MIPINSQRSKGVFISYKHEDRFIAETLADRLREIGFQPWIDFGSIEGGEAWRRAIETGLQNSFVFLVLLTPESVQSLWVKYEIDQAIKMKRPIIPLLIRPCVLPSVIADLQHIDFSQNSQTAFKSLHRAILSVLVQEHAPSANSQPPSSASMLSDAPTQPLPVFNEITEESEAIRVRPLVLVIEDTSSHYEILRAFFTDEGFDVHVATTPSEAANYISGNQYDLVTLDMHLGPADERDENGRYLLDLLNRKQVEVPIIMITKLDYDKRTTSEFFMTERIKGMLDKPVDINRLRSLVNRYARRGGRR